MQQIGTILIPYRMLMLLGIAISIFGCLAIVFVASMKRIIGGMQERKTLLSEEEILKTNWGDASLLDKNKAMRQVVAPNGVDPNICKMLFHCRNAKENCVCEDVYIAFKLRQLFLCHFYRAIERSGEFQNIG